MKMEVVTQADQMRVNLEGRLDEVGSMELEKGLQGLDPLAIKQVVMDFREVSYVGSAGVGVLLLLYKKLASHQGRLSIQNIPKGIYTLLAHDMNLGQVFNLSSM
jgi:anti-sigma B factor antagonist